MSQQKENEQKAEQEAKALAQQQSQAQQRINQLVEQARLENPETNALHQLFALSQDPSLPLQSQGQAALQYAELLFEFDHADAFDVCKTTMKQWSEHPYLPHMHNFLAMQWEALGNNEAAMSELILALRQPVVDAYTLAENIELATPLLDTVAQSTRFDWLLAVARQDKAHEQTWLKQAASIASMDDVLRLRHSSYPLSFEQADFYRHFARNRLMVGDYRAVRLTAKILENDMPDSDVYSIVQTWAESKGSRMVIGVMLPLTGKYALYGQQVLRGIRLAMDKPEFESNVILNIQDTASRVDQAVYAYQTLIQHGVDWVIGPMLSSHTQALIPFLVDHIPVVSLSSKVQLASESPALLIHSLAKVVQANFMARYALQQGKTKAVIIHENTNSAIEEVSAFAHTFINAGGEVLDIVALPESVRDNRPDLIGMRFRTDDEELLASLDEDLFLFSPEQNMDIKMPLAFDHIYLVAQGKRVAVLAGQIAYADIHGVQLYGSQRWADGHLMDDHGRYLNGAQFSMPATSVEQPHQAVLEVQNQYRIVWDNHDMSPLFALAYDTAMNAATIGSRLGLKGKDAFEVLHSTTEFPAISGNYYFDVYGISQKRFAIQRVRRNHVETIHP